MSSALCLTTVAESTLTIKMGFLRRYFGIIASEYIFISLINNVIMMSPVARFYISENDWLLLCFAGLFCASYVSLVRIIKHQVLVILLHIGIKAITLAVFVTYFDMMCILQAFVFFTCIIIVLFLYTLQSKIDLNIWAIMHSIECQMTNQQSMKCLCVKKVMKCNSKCYSSLPCCNKLISCFSLIFGSLSLNIIFGGTEEENIFSILITILLLLYQFCGLLKIINTLTSIDYVLAVVNLHLLPYNCLTFSLDVYKPFR